jgi:hypothetical protein
MRLSEVQLQSRVAAWQLISFVILVLWLSARCAMIGRLFGELPVTALDGWQKIKTGVVSCDWRAEPPDYR